MINILRVSNLPHDMLSVLQTTYLVHDRDHITDPGALGRIRAMVGTDSVVIDKKLMMLFPAVEMICICGETTQHVDLEAAAQRNILVKHTPMSIFLTRPNLLWASCWRLLVASRMPTVLCATATGWTVLIH